MFSSIFIYLHTAPLAYAHVTAEHRRNALYAAYRLRVGPALARLEAALARDEPLLGPRDVRLVRIWVAHDGAVKSLSVVREDYSRGAGAELLEHYEEGAESQPQPAPARSLQARAVLTVGADRQVLLWHTQGFPLGRLRHQAPRATQSMLRDDVYAASGSAKPQQQQPAAAGGDWQFRADTHAAQLLRLEQARAVVAASGQLGGKQRGRGANKAVAVALRSGDDGQVLGVLEDMRHKHGLF
jgi:hypothetical protein